MSKFAIYLLMEDQKLYHLLNFYKTKELAEIHLNKLKEVFSELKIIKVETFAADNIYIEEFERIWKEQQPVAV